MHYKGNAFEESNENNNFRKVLFTGKKCQLVVMDIKPGEEIGEETHDHVEQILFFLSGKGKSVLDGAEGEVNTGDVVVVPPGMKHNFLNTGMEMLKVFTVYTPPNHIDGRIHVTPKDAAEDAEDEAFGSQVA